MFWPPEETWSLEWRLRNSVWGLPFLLRKKHEINGSGERFYKSRPQYRSGGNKMKIENLTQLKKALSKGTVIEVVKHELHPAWAGFRVVNVVQSNCVYVQLYKQPEHLFSKYNGGRGIRMDFAPAAHYVFDDPVAWYDRPVTDPEKRMIMIFRIIESK